MSRPIWTGSMTFGLVTVPVALHSATRDLSVRFHQFEQGTSSRIRYRRVNDDTGEEVDYDDIVKGYDVGGGDYVIVSAEELESVEPGGRREIEISAFVDEDDIDPIHFQKTYYVAPRDESAARPYRVLMAAMEQSGRAAVATFVMRTKEYLATIRPIGGLLALETMFFADEIRDPSAELDEFPFDGDLADRDVRMAEQLIDAMSADWDPSEYHDSYRERVLEMIAAKQRGDEVVTSSEEPRAAEVVDLMAVLEQSVAAARGRRTGDRPADVSGADLSSKSKSELYDTAQELDIDGRSSMTKAELIEAIRALTPTEPRRVVTDDGRRSGCTGTAVEHRGGGWECTVSGCTTALELHLLFIRCDDVACGCTPTSSSATDRGTRACE